LYAYRSSAEDFRSKSLRPERLSHQEFAEIIFLLIFSSFRFDFVEFLMTQPFMHPPGVKHLTKSEKSAIFITSYARVSLAQLIFPGGSL